ncbi:MAG: glycoside hydrolase family 78 protein [Candidatus Latescibacteria bacterium]|nr:glycoside hydrolase family 78 protein [Candidatus Latescibacterota bacterium]
MKTWMIVAVSVILAFGSGCAQKKGSDMIVTQQRCEYLKNPLGIDAVKPRLSWILESYERGQVQTAYRVLVATSEKNLSQDIGDLWDSGKVASDRTAQIEYEGKPLKSQNRCFWKVCVWDKNGQMSKYSEPAYWTMGLLNENDWKGSWIGKKMAGNPENAQELEPGPPPPWLRKTFTVDKTVKKAFVYVTSRGLFELHINGKRVGKDIFSPEWTDYAKRIQYRTYDVTSMIASGDNAIGAVVGDGWYSGYIGWRKVRGYYGFQNSLLLQLEIEYTDGSTNVITSDSSWKVSDGPIIYSDLMMGEYYDARKELPGWSTATFNDSAWEPVVIVDKPTVPLVAQPSEPVQITEYVEPIEITEPKPGVYVFNLGQNIAGWAQIRLKGPAGSKVTMRFAERLNPDGTIYTTNLRSAKATDTYILKGTGEEIYEPRFTFHGFQYIEVTGFTGDFSTKSVIGCVVHSNTPPAGVFECTNPMVNKLWNNARWGQRGNFISVPTDCPQRDERLGWMGDAQIFVRTATYTMDTAAFYTKWLIDVNDAQSPEGAFADFSPRLKDDQHRKFEAAPAWGDAGVIVPWTIYRVYNDTRIIDNHWGAMEKWMDFILRDNPDFIRKNTLNNNYGDWLMLVKGGAGWAESDPLKVLLATAFWAYDAQLLAKMAKATGRNADAAKYEKLFENIRSAFQKEFVEPDGHVKSATQTAYLLALHMNLMPENLRSKAAEYLVEDIRNHDWHLTTGFVGCGFLNPVLTEMGYSDVAYRLLLNDTYPSWGYSIKHGATTIWERWDGWTEDKGFQDPGMNSFNHYSFGSVVEWMYRYVAGIDLDPDVAGFKRFIIHPYPGGNMDHVRAVFVSIHGNIASEWQKNGDKFSLNVTVPVNTSAKVYVPTDEETKVSEMGKPLEKVNGVKYLGYEDGCVVLSAESGTYRFESVLTK